MSNAVENVEVEEDEGFEVEIEDTSEDEAPAKEEPVKAEKVGKAETESSDEDVDKYSDRVQKRIDQLKYEYHEERRAKEAAAQLQEEAVRYAQQVKEENDKLRKSLQTNEEVLLTQAQTRVGAQLEQAKVKYKAAYESGDPDALLEAQEQLTKLQNEQFRFENYKPAPAPEPAPAPQAQAQQPAPQVQKPPQRALDWAESNKWFGSDKRMTGFAYGVHEELIQNGVDGNSEEYYNQIDAAMRQAFPDKFEVVAEEPAPQQQKTGNVVAPTSRTSKKPRKVKLSPSAAALAKRLGLTAEQYAAQLMKDN